MRGDNKEYRCGREVKKVEEQKRCIACMEPLPWDGRCSCGFEPDKYQPDSRWLPPDTLLHGGDYRLGKVLGAGGFGITYIGFDTNLLNVVAIKEYYPVEFAVRDTRRSDGYVLRTFGGNRTRVYEKGMETFLREARILAKFSQLDGIVKIRNFFKENGTAYIVMEYIDGISVKEYVKTYGKIEGSVVLGMMKKAMFALQMIHEEHLVHRDVSADNFMITKNGTLTLIDFGSARYSNVLDQKTRTVMYKSGYSALEQYSAEGKQGAWTDVYGICATMYYMLTGIVPQSATDRVLKDNLLPLGELEVAGLAKEQQNAIMKGLSLDRGKRFQTMSEFYSVLYQEKLQVAGTEHFEIWEKVKQKNEEQSATAQGELPAVSKMLSVTYLARERQRVERNRKRQRQKSRLRGVGLLFIIILCFGVGLFVIGQAIAGEELGQKQLVNRNSQHVSENTVDWNEKDNIGWQDSTEQNLTVGDVQRMTASPEPERILVENYIGLTKKKFLEQTEDKLPESIRIIWQKAYHSKIAKGRICRQNKKAGVDLETAGTLILTISKGKASAEKETDTKSVSLKNTHVEDTTSSKDTKTSSAKERYEDTELDGIIQKDTKKKNDEKMDGTLNDLLGG